MQRIEHRRAEVLEVMVGRFDVSKGEGIGGIRRVT